MKKIYTCHFDSVKVGKKVLKNLNFASINKKEWIGVDSNNLTISDYTINELELRVEIHEMDDNDGPLEMISAGVANQFKFD
jgi:hypothetical protein